MTTLFRRMRGSVLLLALTATAALAQDAVVQAKAQMAENKLDEALGTLNNAQEELKDNPELYVTRGMIFLKQEKAADAEKELSRAIQLNPKHAYAHYYMGMTQSKLKRTDRMITEYEMFLQLAPTAPEAARVRSLLRSI
jgi:tetratricopeptide (TPR) repeat protein